MSGRKITFLLITIPIVALFFCFNTLPLIKGVIYSFTNFKGYGSFDWVGLRNYQDLFTDSRVGGSYLFTFKLAVVATIVTNVISLILALGLNSKIKFKSAFRGAYFIPNVLGALVVGYIFNYFFYIYSSGFRRNAWKQDPFFQYVVQYKASMDRSCDRVCMAVDCDEYHYLYFWTADSSGGCLRSRSD